MVAKQDTELSLADRMIVALAGAHESAEGMDRALDLLWRESGAERVEWWAARDDDSPMRLEAATGVGGDSYATYSLGSAGLVLVFGGRAEELASALGALAPILRRRRAEERLAGTVVELARRNEALEDFAALVAHELKTPLLDVAHGGDPASAAARALDLVDAILEAARAATDAEAASVTECLGAVLREGAAPGAAVESSIDGESPLPATALCILLRNLIANASAAGARRIGVCAAPVSGSWELTVVDDGVGIDGGGYASGSGVGLRLCRRLAERFDAKLELEPRGGGGTRARLVVAGGVS